MCLAEQMQVDEDIQALLNECKDAREMCEAWRGLYYEIKKLKQTDKKCT
jgi:iron-sulfur cluster repair protein YtfE (RIC family)